MRGFKAKVAILLAAVLIFGGVPVGLAMDYHQAALDYLAQKYSVPVDSIFLKGSILEFAYIGEQFWVGRYSLDGEWGQVPGGAGVDPVDPVQGRAEPAPDPAPAGDELVAPDDAAPSNSWGVIMIRIKTGEFLTGEEAEVFFERDMELQREEWERLSKEAGKISVHLYQRLLNASPGEKFEVIIWPLYVETKAMRDALDKVYEEYPDLQFKDAAPPFREGTAEPRVLLFTDAEKGNPDEPVSSDGISEADLALQKRYDEMYRRIEEIRLQGYADSLGKIKGALKEMGIKYDLSAHAPGVLCHLTAPQILSFKDADFLESIGDEKFFVALDGAAPVRLSGESGDDSSSIYLWLIPVPIILAGAAAGIVLFCRRKVKVS